MQKGRQGFHLRLRNTLDTNLKRNVAADQRVLVVFAPGKEVVATSPAGDSGIVRVPHCLRRWIRSGPINVPLPLMHAVLPTFSWMT